MIDCCGYGNITSNHLSRMEWWTKRFKLA